MSKNIGVDAAKLAGLQIDQNQKLRDHQMTIEQMEWWLKQTKKTRDNLVRDNIVAPNLQKPTIVPVVNDGNEHLKYISNGQDPIIPACDGSRVISKAKEVFPGYIDSDFVNWNANGDGWATSEMPAPVFEMIKNGDFGQILGIDIGNLANVNSADVKRLRQMVLTPHQIIEFVVNNRGWLRTDKYATFFPYESHGNFFVAVVLFPSVGQLKVLARRFEGRYEWAVESQHRFVLSQLA
jgi:hypothetical protein